MCDFITIQQQSFYRNNNIKSYDTNHDARHLISTPKAAVWSDVHDLRSRSIKAFIWKHNATLSPCRKTSAPVPVFARAYSLSTCAVMTMTKRSTLLVVNFYTDLTYPWAYTDLANICGNESHHIIWPIAQRIVVCTNTNRSAAQSHHHTTSILQICIILSNVCVLDMRSLYTQYELVFGTIDLSYCVL